MYTSGVDTLTTPSECPVTMTFCVSHSFISDTQQHRICWLRPVKVLALEMGLPLMLHTWMYVPAQDTMSPYTHRHTHTRISSGNRCVALRTLDGWENWVFWLTVSSLMHRAQTGARCPLSWVTNDNLFRSQMMQVRSREPLTTMRYADDAVRHVTASV